MKDVNILINNGANIKKALELFGDMETYDATLETFLQEVPGKLKKIKACKEIGDMANYAILVHSLKSDARYFGFETLGELAYDHELKSKANDMYYVSEHFNELMTEANRVVNLVKKYMGVGVVDESSYKEPIKTSDKAILVVDDSNIIRNFILKILDDSFDVISATDGKEAIDILESEEKRKKCTFEPIGQELLVKIDGEYIKKKYKNIQGQEFGEKLHQERVKWMKMQHKIK